MPADTCFAHRPYPPRALEVMSAQETVVAVAAGTGAAVVAKTINTNKLADTLSKTRKTRWFRWVDINVPNDFAEADAHQADPNIIANAPTLETLGKLVTVGYVPRVSRAVPCRDFVTEPGLEAPLVAVHREDSTKSRPAPPTEKADKMSPPSASAPQEVLHRRHHGAVPDGVLRPIVHGVRGRLQALELRGLQQVPRPPARPAMLVRRANLAVFQLCIRIRRDEPDVRVGHPGLDRLRTRTCVFRWSRCCRL